jgi:hypothetical protein
MSQYRAYFVPGKVDPNGTQTGTVIDMNSMCWRRCAEQLPNSPIVDTAKCVKRCGKNKQIVFTESCKNIRVNPVSACRHLPAFQYAHDLYVKKCKRAVLLSCNKKGWAHGVYNPTTHAINVEDLGGFVSCITLAHELLHAADECSRPTISDPKDPNYNEFDRCESFMCKEARANVYVNCCNYRHNINNDENGFQACVASRKRKYLRYFDGVGRRTKEEFWDACLPKDLSISVCDSPIPAFPLQ